MNDKELLYQFLDREIDNAIAAYIPSFRFLAGPVKNWLFNYIDPYVDLFFMGSDKLNTTAVKKFATEEATEKINSFIKKFEDERNS